ncbi:MAG: DUF4250 domain-containing protein [Muribaculaceae bacterium]|nr:DUF4250 domain-containing protein [Muribaculaceae bacterium]
MLPQDPIMLLSFINTRLRDEYPSLDELCASLDLDRSDLESQLSAIGFEYVPSLNQFK